MSRSKKKESELPLVVKQDRKFKKTSTVPDVLKCPICMDIFHEPTRLFCGHTFCFDCLQQWIKASKTCPKCREAIDRSNIGKDLLAYHMINELEVFCPHEECSWQGSLEMLHLHLFYECFYNQIKPVRSIPEEAEDKLGDEEVEDKINENIVRGNLLSRVLRKEETNKSSRSFDMARKLLPKEKSHGLQEKNREEVKKQLEATHHDDFDFLMELYSNSH